MDSEVGTPLHTSIDNEQETIQRKINKQSLPRWKKAKALLRVAAYSLASLVTTVVPLGMDAAIPKPVEEPQPTPTSSKKPQVYTGDLNQPSSAKNFASFTPIDSLNSSNIKITGSEEKEADRPETHIDIVVPDQVSQNLSSTVKPQN